MEPTLTSGVWEWPAGTNISTLCPPIPIAFLDSYKIQVLPRPPKKRNAQKKKEQLSPYVPFFSVLLRIRKDRLFWAGLSIAQRVERLSGKHESRGFMPALHKLDMMLPTCNPCTQKMKAGGSDVQSLPQIRSELAWATGDTVSKQMNKLTKSAKIEFLSVKTC